MKCHDDTKPDTICGREFTVTKPGPQGTIPSYSKSPKPRSHFLVSGINHRNGQPIRFKSRANAERHIQNLGLVIAS